MQRYLWSLALLIVVLVGQSLALKHGFILRAPSFHIVIHILAGIGIGLLVAALIHSWKPDLARRRLAVILGVLIFGIVWELFEAYYDITGFKLWTAPYYLDTLKDLGNDLIGGIIAVLLAIHSPRASLNEK